MEINALLSADCAPTATILFVILPCSKGSGKLAEYKAVSSSLQPGFGHLSYPSHFNFVRKLLSFCAAAEVLAAWNCCSRDMAEIVVNAGRAIVLDLVVARRRNLEYGSDVCLY
jgi:hypothetical protein